MKILLQTTLLVFLGTACSYASILFSVAESGSGVDISYSGTWDVGHVDAGGSQTLTADQSNVAVFDSGDSRGISFTCNGADQGGWYAIDEYIIDAPATGTVPVFTYPGSDSNLEGTTLTGTLGTDTFGLDILDNGLISLYGKNGGWFANDPVSGSAGFAGQTLASIGLTTGSGSFAVAGQNIDWNIYSIPEPSTCCSFLLGLAAIRLVRITRNR